MGNVLLEFMCISVVLLICGQLMIMFIISVPDLETTMLFLLCYNLHPVEIQTSFDCSTCLTKCVCGVLPIVPFAPMVLKFLPFAPIS